jgi:hypothetical protein
VDAEYENEIGRPRAESEELVESENLVQLAAQEPAASVEAAAPGRVAVETVGMAVPEIEPTGQVDVDAALDRLRELGERPTGAHPDLYDGVHQRLQDVLAQIDHQDAGR